MKIFIQENEFKNVVCNLPSILFGPKLSSYMYLARTRVIRMHASIVNTDYQCVRMSADTVMFEPV